MSNLNWLILAVQVADLAFTMKSAGFMVDMTENMNKKLRYLRDRIQDLAEQVESMRPLPPPSNTRLQQSGLIDIYQAQTYDPRFADEEQS
jgi:hypothetical protein